MADDVPFVGEPADSREAIMRATHRALHEHGYAGLSIQRIADEADLSKSTFYHHFDDKEDLLQAFLEFILAEYTRVFTRQATGDPARDVRTYIDMAFGDIPDDAVDVRDEKQMVGTYVELRAQAVQNDAYRETITRTDEGFKDQLATIIRDGIEQGVFQEVDPDRTAEMVGTIIDGALFRWTTRTDDPTEEIRAEIEAFIEDRLLTDR